MDQIIPDPRDQTSPREKRRGQAIARGALAAALAIAALYTLRGFLPALAWASIFAIALWPLYARAERRWPPGKHNILLPALFTAGVALVFIIPVLLLGAQVGQDAHGLISWMEQAHQNGIPVPQFIGRLPVGSQQVTDWWQTNLSQPGHASKLLARVDRGSAMEFGQHFGLQLLRRLTIFLFTLLTLFFLFRDGHTLSGQLTRAGRRAFGPSGERVAAQVVASVHGTVNGLVLVGLGEGVLLGIAYAVLGVPHPTIFGAVTAVAAIIPFGAPVAFCAAALLLLANGAMVGAIIIVCLGMLITFVADHFIRPVLIGGATKLPFIWVLFGILGGVEAWGLLGLFLGPAIMAALILLWREWTSTPAEALVVETR
jgi:predicted PurR-regulated permease PerM